ncbi:hypothetical protein SO802_012177 [Lithocarpus litseifolius]|uniref:DDE Tnp4 domain-containing protein n=1 Tax=Lithocarpus litseifolius TaxID=425828 RepID=A0AAW2D2R5_9ROSI
MALHKELADTASSSSVIPPFSSSSSNAVPTPKRYRTFAQLIGRTRMGWELVTNTVTGSDEAWAYAMAGVHASVEPNSPDDVEELPPLDIGQCSNPKGKQPSHSDTSTGKKRKKGSIDKVTDAIIEFTEMSRKRRNDKESESLKTIEFVPMCDPLSMDKAVAILNTIDNVDDLTLFKKCIEAIDGTHINAHAPAYKSTSYKDRSRDISQIVMCACNFDMRFTYVHAGWEGNAHDSQVMQEALGDPGFQFPWPPRGLYYLVDSRYAIGSAFLPPHKSVKYHAQEFRGSARQPRTPQELFNYRHSSLCIVIKRCFGVMKASHFDEMFHACEGQDMEPGDASTSGGVRVGGGGNDEAFSPQAQQAMPQF